MKRYKQAIIWYTKSGNINSMNRLINITINKDLYDFVFELLIHFDNEKIKNILLNKLPKEYILNKHLEEISRIKSIKTQGIDKQLINSIMQHL